MSTRPGPVDEDSSSCLSGGEGEGAVSQEDYVKLRNMINKQIIDPLQEADHHQQQGWTVIDRLASGGGGQQ
ncbi:hypothetical protein Pmar_PMAR011659 [Perkinsus marinus ATCC 50983]|uniref:Uncharacterized protein n=1 Tax=Perkinsus marinus (strain ATCC 50983 / TXsc) TaxID=423536 RepID=C5LCE8_PERM5|nr:hypothetical protein Pmar_PMAR011659 [Perkinsus marinus ATCC 50983]EER05631.1 hypothetical protein Pmar_PMAR011659 [Perkinsus marinus ATCC 50983]|eukprot:XP_002773815.1 hypothetical protein Pmar_PMAR011659 [Perkinsus marinus ATCC 50983]